MFEILLKIIVKYTLRVHLIVILRSVFSIFFLYLKNVIVRILEMLKTLSRIIVKRILTLLKKNTSNVRSNVSI